MNDNTPNFSQKSQFHIGDEIGSFIIVNELSANELGGTFLCQHSMTGKLAIIKTFPLGIENDPGFMQRFQLTREKLINFRHFNILSTRNLEFENNKPYAILEFLNVKDQVITLKTLFDQKKKFSESQIVKLAMGLCQALAYAHACRGGIIHCNLKPSNILFSPSGTPLLSEFGLLNLLGQQRFANLIELVESQKEVPDSLKETYQYMSPEQRLSLPITTQSNIYSLGLILFHAITGEDYNRDAPQPLPKKWKAILEHCLANDPKARYSKINEMAHQIRTTFLRYLFLIKVFLPILLFSSIIIAVLYMLFTLSTMRPLLDLPQFIQPSMIKNDIESWKTNRIYNENYAPPVKASEIPSKIVPIEGVPWKIDDLNMVFQPSFSGTRYFRKKDNTLQPYFNKDHFWTLSTEVTQAQFLKIMGYDPSNHRHRTGKICVHNVTKKEAIEFCKRLTLREQQALKLPRSMEYRLPKSSEWVFASLPNTDSEESINIINNWNVTSWNKSNSQARLHMAGLKIPSSQLLYDMHGNAQEWVIPDSSYAALYQSMTRGCDYTDNEDDLWYNSEKEFPLDYQSNKIGFRIILSYK